LEEHRESILRRYRRCAKFFANGEEVDPAAIRPLLVEVTEPWQSDLFNLARYTWSLPYTKGYGRRLRFLIMDESNGKLMGILGLQSPPLDFPARDRLFDYPVGEKVVLVNQTMDVFTLGALPPYNRLLAGKLVALAAASNEVREAFVRKYRGRLTEMEHRELPAELVALTTTSAFGRSSLYNRLRFEGRWVAESIGYTEGYGSFHLATLYPLLREFLEEQGISTRGGFGTGPRLVWQTCVKALSRLGYSSEILRHGLRREVFLFPLVSNLGDYMAGRTATPAYHNQSFSTLAEWWCRRWLAGRADRVEGWQEWRREELASLLMLAEDSS
jgi:hypothetical protein